MNIRLTAMLLAMIMLLTLTACNRDPADSATAETSAETTMQTVPGVEKAIDDWDEEDNYSTELPTESTSDSSVVETTEPTTPNGDSSNSSPEEDENTSSSVPETGTTDFERYNAMTGEEQMAFMESFESVEAFFSWYNAAKAEYDAAHPGIDIGNGNIDLGEIIGGNG